MSAADNYLELPQGFQFSAAAASSGDISIPNWQSMTIVAYSAGLSGAGQVQLIFNADTGANYVNRYITAAAGGVTLVDNTSASAAAFIFTPSQTLGFLAVFKVSNFITASKAISFRIWYQTADKTTVPSMQFGGGEWVNITAAITQVRMSATANNINVNSGFKVFGGNPL